MTVQSKIRRKAPEVRPSRIRREPVRVKTPAELQAEEASAREREMRRGIGGIVLFAAAIAVLIVGIGVATYSKFDPVAAAREAARFRQCYNTAEGNCVLDGDTIRFEGQWVDIAGLAAPQIKDAACADERIRGIDAAVRLADLLNSGTVTVSDPSRDQYGRTVRKVEVNGKDVGKAMLSAHLVRPYNGEQRDWCAGRSDAGA